MTRRRASEAEALRLQEPTVEPCRESEAQVIPLAAFRHQAAGPLLPEEVAAAPLPEIPIEIEPPDPEASSAVRLYARHAEYARALALKLTQGSQLGTFASEEAIDAALEGLLDAAQLWQERTHQARFTTYAYWHIKGSILSRAEEVRRSISLDAGEEAGIQPWSLGLTGMPEAVHRGGASAGGASWSATLQDEVLARRIEPYVEQQLFAMGRQQRMAEVLLQLRASGGLAPLEERIVDPLLLEQRPLAELIDECDATLAQLRVAAVRLMQKLRRALRDDSLFPAGLCRVPLDELPATRAEVLTLARETLSWLGTETHGSQTSCLVRAPDEPPVAGGPRCHPLGHFKRFLPDLEATVQASGLAPRLKDCRTPFARVASFYKHALGLNNGDLADELEMKRPAVEKMMLRLNLDHRQSPSRLVSVANALSIDPEQLLFSAAPEVLPAFDRVIHAGEDAYLAVIEVQLPPGELVEQLLAPPGPGQAHAFGGVISAYRLARGIGSAATLGRYFKGFEAGAHTSVEGTSEMAAAVGMPPLLALLGTRPELLAVFDVLDGQGQLLHASQREHARLVIVLLRTERPTGAIELEPPEVPGLAEFVAFLLHRRGPVLTPRRLEQAGVSPLLLANALAGRPPHQPEALQPLTELLRLNPFEEARLCCEALLARLAPELEEELRELIDQAREQSHWYHLLSQHDWPEHVSLMTADPDATRELSQDFFGRSRRGYRSYIRDLLQLWRDR